ncbi:Alkaline ceramidase 3 [Tolypocladium capitatum]|uniref:Alkaline ceramidase 3 n=1 Tax=Tolypocladium capitatum TaxID=45235 RepID=A0A2K3QP17_9HYPO|nr:Alkaline ceramidase 3 [Tolypocladium capitatum]
MTERYTHDPATMAWADILGALKAPYPDHSHGFWGEQTSTLNFCEEDYALSFYCAELCNTVTNALFLWLGAKGISNCLRESHATIFVLAYIGYIVVGLGSILFHATLKYPMQLVDELSMIYTTCLMMYASFAYSRSRAFSVLLGVSLLALAGSITAYYHITKDPVFHQGAYAALTATVVFRSMWVMESQVRPLLEARDRDRSRRVLKATWLLVATGLTIFVMGFAIWNLDNVLCSQLRRWRRAVGLPWAVVLEGHAWWHLMTGLGGFAQTNAQP